MSRDGLTDLLWPEVPPAKGRHSLSQALLAIRERLGADALTRRERDVQLLVELTSDFDHLEDGGPTLPSLLEPLLGIEDCAGVEFAHWADGTRARLHARAREALRAGLRAARVAGDLARVHRLAALLHGIDPLCAEAVHALAERALLDGDVVMAVRLLKEQLRRARSELGTNPNPEIAQLLRRLERGERPSFMAQASDLRGAMTRREVFVGRELELSRLEAAWDRARATGYQTCLITGVPGIGKSSLLRRFATSLAARAWPALVVPCQEIGQGIPYAAVSELITALGRDPAAGGTDPQWLAEASRVSPALRVTYPGIPEPPNAPTDSIRLRVAEAVLRMMEAVTEGGPILLGFDDVQHMDPASREVLFLVTRRLERTPALLLATARPDEAELAGSPGVGRGSLNWAETVELQPLPPDQAMHLIDDILVDATEVDARIRDTIVRLSQGNPYFVEMLLADWKQHEATSLVAAESSGDRTIASWNPPHTLRSAFARHYRGLSLDAQHLLQLLAVAERAIVTSEIATLLGLESGVVERGVLEVLDRGIGRVEAGRIAFKNELHRAYTYYAIGEERRSYFHTRLAETLSRPAPGEDFQRTLEASHHYVSARMPAEARETALKGADLAIRRGAPGEAERALGTLLKAYPQDSESRVHVVLATALVAEGKYRDALETLARWSPTSPAPRDRAVAAQLKAEAMHRALLADGQTILSAATEAVSIAEESGTDLTLIRALQTRAEVAAESGNVQDAESAEARAQRVAAQSSNPESKALAEMTRGYCMLVTGQLEGAVASFSTAGPMLARLGLLVDLRRVMNGLGICYTGMARFAEAVRSIGNAVAIARKLGDRVASCNTWTNLGAAYHDAGLFELASTSYQNGLALLPVISRVAAPLYTAVARLAMECGDFAHAERHAAMALSAARESGFWRPIVSALGAMADLRLARGEPESAWALVEEAAGLADKRSHQLDDAGQFARLKRHMSWATAGYESVLQLEPELRIGSYANLADALQIEAFTEWIAHEEGDTAMDEKAAQEIVRRGLFGVLSRLIAVGLRFRSVPERRPGESSAQLVARVYQPRERLGLPEIDELLQQGDVLSHSA